MTWVKIDSCPMSRRAAVFFACERTVLSDNDVKAQFLAARTDIEELDCAARALIERHRPELAGCTIHAINYSMDMARWEFLVCHGSLPLTTLYSDLPVRPLVYPREQLTTNA
jgi:hypothetical protein